MKKYAIFALLFAAAATQMVAFPADGLTFDLKLDIGSIGEASNVSAFILCY